MLTFLEGERYLVEAEVGKLKITDLKNGRKYTIPFGDVIRLVIDQIEFEESLAKERYRYYEDDFLTPCPKCGML